MPKAASQLPRQSGESRPALIWDGDCGFCARCAAFIAARTPHVETIKFQELGDRFPQIDRPDCAKAVQFVRADGSTARAGRALFAALGEAPGWGWLRKFYFVPGVTVGTEAGYRFTANNRAKASKLVRLVGGPDPAPSTWVRSRMLFFLLLGLACAMTCLSLTTQTQLLIGPEGIFPLADTMRDASEAGDVLTLPSMFRWWPTEPTAATYRVLCSAGAALATAMAVGLASALCAVLLWVLMLSLITPLLVFGGMESDQLLLEAMLPAALLASSGLRGLWLAPKTRRLRAPSTLGRLLLLWLLFRVTWQSGLAKWGGTTAWQDFSATHAWLWTQPVPSATGLAAAVAVPGIVFTIATIFVMAAELVLPWFLFLGRRARLIAVLGLLMVHLGIVILGNPGVIEVVYFALLVMALDDQTLAKLLPKSMRCTMGAGRIPFRPRWKMIPRVGLALLLFLLSWAAKNPTTAGDESSGLRFDLFRVGRSLHVAHHYEIGKNMPTVRPELIVQVSPSNDGGWQPVDFPIKTGRGDRRPASTWLRAPRLAHVFSQTGIAVLDVPGVPIWLDRLLDRFLQSASPLRAKIESVDGYPLVVWPPPRVRVAVYSYTPAGEEARANGAWWERELKGVLTAPRSAPLNR